jgi:hypothetical protein
MKERKSPHLIVRRPRISDLDFSTSSDREGQKLMTKKEYLGRLGNELHYGEERLRVIEELLNDSPEASDDDFDQAWADSKLAWQV